MWRYVGIQKRYKFCLFRQMLSGLCNGMAFEATGVARCFHGMNQQAIVRVKFRLDSIGDVPRRVVQVIDHKMNLEVGILLLENADEGVFESRVTTPN